MITYQRFENESESGIQVSGSNDTSSKFVADSIHSLVDDLIQRAVSQSSSTATNSSGTSSTDLRKAKQGGIWNPAGVSAGSSENHLTETTGPMQHKSDADDPLAREESSSKSGTSYPAACQLEWEGKGKVVCGRAPTAVGLTDPPPGAVGSGPGSPESAEETCLVDDAEIFRWMGSWDEAIQAVRSRDSGEIRHSRRPLFNPAQVTICVGYVCVCIYASSCVRVVEKGR